MKEVVLLDKEYSGIEIERISEFMKDVSEALDLNSFENPLLVDMQNKVRFVIKYFKED